MIAPTTGPEADPGDRGQPRSRVWLCANNLEIEGYEVEVAKDGTRGLSRARTASPDLVVLDLMLPGMGRLPRAARAARGWARHAGC